MGTGKTSVYTGTGHGKTPAALGIALQQAARGESVVVIQFLKGKGLEESEFCHRMEPELKIFRFEKSDYDFSSRSEEEKQDELNNIRNGLNYARKVLCTFGCDLLVLDEVLALVDNRIIEAGELAELLEKRGETDIIMTGISVDPVIAEMADEVVKLETKQ